jgi:uncharacterized protein (DUF1684 family)
MRFRGSAFTVLTLAAVVLAASENGYQSSIERWRQEREARLKADGGWLSVAGLFWLKPGVNSAGSGASSAIVLPRVPAHVGDFEFHDGKTTFKADPAVAVSVNGKPATSAALRSDSDPGGPDQVTVGRLTMFVIHRGARYAIRLKDLDSEFRASFKGLHWYPVHEDYRVIARWVPYDKPRTIAVPNILGETEQEPSPGYAVFTLHGHEYRLDPVLEGNQLFFIFRDQTSGKETYGSGRFLYTDMAKEGKVVLDFNKAYNPPCAFTPYATCPLPPKQNRLAVRLEAGELNYAHK